MKQKYGLTKECTHCKTEFVTKPRFLEYCSTPCKNPINRPGNIAWNKGVKHSQEYIEKNMNLSGLSEGHGYWKGKKNPEQSKKWSGEGNPNWEGKVNNTRPKKEIDDAFLLYKVECRKVTYRSVRRMRSEGLVPKTGKKKTDLQLDHIIPYGQGYEQGLPPELIGSSVNLQYILGSDNRKKWDTFQSSEDVEHIQEAYNGLQ